LGFNPHAGKQIAGCRRLKIIANGWPFEIVDRDGRRIYMVLATKSEAT